MFSFSNNYAKCIYEILNKEKASFADKKDESFLLGQAVPMELDEETVSSESDESESEEEDNGVSDSATSKFNADKNSILALGFKSDRAFVSRGSAIGVFKTTDDNRLSFETTIKSVATPKDKKIFCPTKLMLHNNDSNMILMNPLEDNLLYKMDLERGEVVEEWKVDEYAPVTNIIPDSKYAQMTACQTLIGLNNNSIFRIDPRLPGTKRVEAESKQYVVKNEFSCGATTASGELAVASRKGDIRLFNKLDKRAKTLLPGFGGICCLALFLDPILGIDTTDDGKAILATCRNYLLLINTDVGDGKNTGFTKSLGSEKPVPIRLQLKPEHVAYMGGQSIAFTEAHFSTGEAADRSIIASTGPYVITWTMKSIKQGKLYDYSIKKYSDVVVADNFKYGQDRNIIVTLPDQVAMISKNSLLSPKKLRSFNGVVDSPF